MDEPEIRWSKNAELDLFETLQFYTHRNQNTMYSESILSEISSATSNLLQFPMLGRPFDDNLRVLVVLDYNIYYEIQGKSIRIHLFWDTRRNSIDLEVSLRRVKLYE